MNLEDRLTNHLREENQRAVVAGAGSSAAVARAGQRKRRNTGMVAATMVFLCGIVGAAALSLSGGNAVTESEVATELNDGEATSPDSDDRASDATESGQADGIATELTGGLVASSSSLGWTTELLVGDDGVYYALSTVPGDPGDVVEQWPPDQAIYRSDDGSEWTVAPQRGNWIAQLQENDGLLYALGTAPGVESSPLVLGVSADAGVTWDETTLEVTSQPPGGAVPFSSGLSSSLAVSDQGILVSASVTYWPDFWQMLTDEQANAGYSIEPRPEGLAVVDYSALDQFWMCEELLSVMSDFEESGEDPAALLEDMGGEFPSVETCDSISGEPTPETAPVVELTPWTDLGLDWDSLQDIDLGQSSELWISADGTTFESVAWPFGTQMLSGLGATGDSYYAVTFDNSNFEFDGPAKSLLWTSSDGRVWTETVSPVGELQKLGELSNGNTVAVGWDGQIATSADSGTSWIMQSLSALVPSNPRSNAWSGDIAINDNGVAIMVTVFTEPEGGYPQEEPPFLDEEFVEEVFPAGDATEPAGPPPEFDGEPIDFPDEEDFAADYYEGSEEHFVLFSSDGVNWQSLSVTDALAEQGTSQSFFGSNLTLRDGEIIILGESYGELGSSFEVLRLPVG